MQNQSGMLLMLGFNIKCIYQEIWAQWYFVFKIVLTYYEKKCSSDWDFVLKIEVEGQEFSKCLSTLEKFIRSVKGQYNFWKRTCSQMLEFKLEKYLEFKNLQEKSENTVFFMVSQVWCSLASFGDQCWILVLLILSVL